MTHQRYELEKITDLLKLSDEQFARFIPDLCEWHKNHSVLAERMRKQLEKNGIKGQVSLAHDKLIWIDDNKKEVVGVLKEIKFKVGENNG